MLDHIKFGSPTNTSATSLVDAIPQLDERKTFPCNNCNLGNAEESSILSHSKEERHELPTDLLELGEQPEGGQTGANERPGFFSKVLRRMIGFFQGKKIDVCPRENSMCFV